MLGKGTEMGRSTKRYNIEGLNTYGVEKELGQIVLEETLSVVEGEEVDVEVEFIRELESEIHE